MPGQEHSSERELAELAALADGSLPIEQRAALEAREAAPLERNRAVPPPARKLQQRAMSHFIAR